MFLKVKWDADVGSCRKPQTGIPLVLGVGAFVYGIRFLLLTMLGVNDLETTAPSYP
jgi:hypothetical protein